MQLKEKNLSEVRLPLLTVKIQTESGDLKKAYRSLREWPKEKLESTSEKSFVPNTSDAKMPDVNAKEKSQRKDRQVSIRKLKT